jgi:toxin ParE1/3/4
MRLILAPLAYTDLDQIEVYTVQTWGERQSAAYLADLFDAFDLIVSKPDMGVLRPDFAEGMRALAVREHVVYYRTRDGVCEIVRLLHRRRHVTGVE